jgi:hydroxymethylglutaryl-CoA synthase
MESVRGLLDALDREPTDYDFVVFHQPNVKFPSSVARRLGMQRDQLATGLLARHIGNTYAGSALIGLTAVLDRAQPGDHVLIASYGSGAGSDAMSFYLTERLLNNRDRAPLTQDYIDRRTVIDYGTYVRHTRKLRIN